jgi:6-phosphogluconolactonase (cycloisomerase 2 family)
MKFNKVGQVSLVSGLALILASTFTACNPVTIDYLFVAGQKANLQGQGQIQTFLVDRVSGALNPVNGTVSSGGVTPVSEAVSTDFQNLYVANQGDSSLVQFSIQADGALKSAATISLDSEGNTPVAIAMNTAGTLLYVANRFQPGCTTATTGAKTCNGGALAVFPVAASGALGTAVANGSLNYWPLGVNPTAVNALPSGAAVYASSYDPAAGLGYVYGFSSSSAGALGAIPGSPFDAGVKPVGVAITPTSHYVYVTDFSQNQLIAFSVLSTGVLHPLINGPFRTGDQPSAITIDPRGIYIYISNELDNTVSAYEIALQTGTPSSAVNTTGTSANTTQTQPVAILVDAGFGRFVYTANFLDSSISGFQLNSSTGTLTPSQSTPYPTVGQPVALASVPHGNHSVNAVQP